MQSRIALDILNEAFTNPANANQWISIPDSSNGIIWSVSGASGGNPGNGWKIHISIDPERIVEAAALIADQLNQPGSPTVSIKFAGRSLAPTGQPSKQAAFIFYNIETLQPQAITEFLSAIDNRLNEQGIGRDPRAINTDAEALQTKYDASILDTNGQPTRFHYRNDNCIVMADELYRDVTGSNKQITTQGVQVLVKQSAFLKMPNSERHNPGNRQADPFANIRLPAKRVSLGLEREIPANNEDISVQRGQLNGYITRALAAGRIFDFRLFGCTKKSRIAAANAVRKLMDIYENTETDFTLAGFLQVNLPALKKHRRALNQGELGRIFKSMLPQHEVELAPRRRKCC